MIVVLVALNVVGVQEAAKLSIALAVIDFATQVLLVLLGFALVFSPEMLVDNIHWGVAPTWANLAIAIPVAMLAYTGVETVSNLAEEAREPDAACPNAYKLVAAAVFTIYFTLPLVALSALPVTTIDGELTTLLALPPEEGGYANDPILGVVENLGLEGGLLDVLQIYVGVLAATILVIATNAGVIGASRITYSMATYRQMPEVFRRLHPRFKTPYLSLVLFAGIAPIVILLPGDVNFVGTLYSLGATLSFTVAHASLVRLRMANDGTPIGYRARPNLRLGGVDWPVFAVFGGLATGASFLVHPRAEPADALGRSRLDGDRPHRVRDLPPPVRPRRRCARRSRRPPPSARLSRSSTGGSSSRSSPAARRTTRSTSPAGSRPSGARASSPSPCSRCRSTCRSTLRSRRRSSWRTRSSTRRSRSATRTASASSGVSCGDGAPPRRSCARRSGARPRSSCSAPRARRSSTGGGASSAPRSTG